MTFAFREVTVSGGRGDVEGTSEALNEITDVLVNEMGWVLKDDRRSQAGSADITLTHKVVFESDGGEVGTDPNWYLTITSGTAAATKSDYMGFQIASAYDTGTHDTAASGVETPTLHSTFYLNGDSNGFFNLWISGDKDSVVFVVNARNVYGMAIAGRGLHFLDNTAEPYGLYLYSAANTNINATIVRSIAGNPPQAFVNSSEGEFLVIPLATTNEPRLGLGQIEPVFTALPVLHTVDDSSPVRKGAIGVVKNAWSGIAQTVGWLKETILTVSGTGQEYVAFPDGSNALIIRKT